MKSLSSRFASLITWVMMASLGLCMARSVSGSNVLFVFLGVVCFIPVLIFTIGPILVHQTHTIKLEPNFRPIDPTSSTTPAEFARFYAGVAEELALLGFLPQRCSQTINSTPNANGFVSLFQNPQTVESARLVTAIADNGLIRDVITLTVFSTAFKDGTLVDTSNRRSPKIFPSYPPPYHGTAFPQVLDLGRLLIIHRALVHRLATGRLRVDPIGNEPDEYLRQKDHIRPLAHHMASGYTYLDESAQLQRLTWKGAILVTWKMTPPIKQIRLAWERIQAARLLRTLEGEGQIPWFA